MMKQEGSISMHTICSLALCRSLLKTGRVAHFRWSLTITLEKQIWSPANFFNTLVIIAPDSGRVLWSWADEREKEQSLCVR